MAGSGSSKLMASKFLPLKALNCYWQLRFVLFNLMPQQVWSFDVLGSLCLLEWFRIIAKKNFELLAWICFFYFLFRRTRVASECFFYFSYQTSLPLICGCYKWEDFSSFPTCGYTIATLYFINPYVKKVLWRGRGSCSSCFCYEFCSVNEGFWLGFCAGEGSMVADCRRSSKF